MEVIIVLWLHTSVGWMRVADAPIWGNKALCEQWAAQSENHACIIEQKV